MSYTGLKWLGIAVLAMGAAVLWAVVNRQQWYTGVLPWIGLLAGLAALLVGGAVTYVGTTGLPLIRQADQPTGEELRHPVQSFAFPLVGSADERSLSRYRGGVVLLNLWATWCTPCMEELPALNRLQDRYRQDKLVVTTLSSEAPDHLARFAERSPFTTVNGYIPDKEALPDPFRRAFRTIPTSYLVDREGYIQEFVLGSRTYAEWEKKVLDVL